MTWIAIGDSDLATLLQEIATEEAIDVELLSPAGAQERMRAGSLPHDEGWSVRALSRVLTTVGRVVVLSTGSDPAVDEDRVLGMTLGVPAPLREMQRAIRWLAGDGHQVDPSVDIFTSSSRA